MKRWIAVTFVLVLALTIAGCKRDDNNVHNEGNTPTLRSEEAVLEGDAITEASETAEDKESYVPEAPSLRSEEEEEKALNTTVPQLKREPIPEGNDTVISNASEYTALIHDLKNIVQYRLSSGFFDGDSPPVSEVTRSAVSFNSENEYKWDNMIFELLGYPEADSLDYFGYILYDLNVDGKPELFFVRKDYSILAVFTVYNGKVVLLDAYWSRYSGCISETGGLYTSSSGGAAYTTIDFLEISDGKFFSKFSYYSDEDNLGNRCYFFEENGVSSPITREEFDGALEWKGNHDKSFWHSLPVQPLY